MGTNRLSNASVAGIWPISSLGVVYYGYRGLVFMADFEVFEILGGLVIYKSYHIRPRYLNKIISPPLGIYKVSF